MSNEYRQLIHNWHLQFLAKEMLRVYTRSAADILNEVFPVNLESSYSLRNQQMFDTRPTETVHYGSNSFSYPGPKIWEINLGNVKAFKFAIKMWLPETCPCGLFRRYVYQVSFL